MFKYVAFTSCLIVLASAAATPKIQSRQARVPEQIAQASHGHSLEEIVASLNQNNNEHQQNQGAINYGGYGESGFTYQSETDSGANHQTIQNYGQSLGQADYSNSGASYTSGHEDSSSSSKNYVSSSELTSLAHTSAQQAKSAVQSQQTAGSQAAFGAKNNLAQAALGAAATAQAALVGKQVIVQSLKHQLQEAEKQLKSEIGQYHQTEQAAKAAQETAQQSQQQVKTLTAALAASQGGASRAVKAAGEAANAAAGQHSMIQDAKQRVNHLTQQLHHALTELKETEASAQKAASAAHIAQSNAAAAANAVAVSAQQNEQQAVQAYGAGSNQDYHKK